MQVLNDDTFREHFVDSGAKRWFIRTDTDPS
jgi:hypothetical protein